MSKKSRVYRTSDKDGARIPDVSDDMHEPLIDVAREKRNEGASPAEVKETLQVVATAEDLPEFAAYKKYKADAEREIAKARALVETAKLKFGETLSPEDGAALETAENVFKRVSQGWRIRVEAARRAWSRAAEKQKAAEQARADLERFVSRGVQGDTTMHGQTYADRFYERMRGLALNVSTDPAAVYLLQGQAKESGKLPTRNEVLEVVSTVEHARALVAQGNRGRISHSLSPRRDQISPSKVDEFIKSNNRVPTPEEINSWWQGETKAERAERESKLRLVTRRIENQRMAVARATPLGAEARAKEETKLETLKAEKARLQNAQ